MLALEEEAGLKPGSKYYPLNHHLRRQEERRVKLRFVDIERLIGQALPHSARRDRAFWSNRSAGVQAEAWMKAGYHVQNVDLAEECVVFARPQTAYQVLAEREDPLWNAEMVQSLRRHMAMSQQDFADELGVRQQTISEWERGIYTPSRSRSKHLSLIAEREGMPFKVKKPGEDDAC